MIPVDILTVLGPGRKIHKDVLGALEDQGNVSLKHYVVKGTHPKPRERRATAIARARNLAKSTGDAYYVMFLDDDVVLPPKAIEKLVYTLFFNPQYAAIGIDYQGHNQSSSWSVHVAMGAVMFLRPILEQIQFRTEQGKCECLCCCEDIRKMGYLIDYIPDLQARHLK
jgi:hypothetical protein